MERSDLFVPPRRRDITFMIVIIVITVYCIMYVILVVFIVRFTSLQNRVLWLNDGK